MQEVAWTEAELPLAVRRREQRLRRARWVLDAGALGLTSGPGALVGWGPCLHTRVLQHRTLTSPAERYRNAFIINQALRKMHVSDVLAELGLDSDASGPVTQPASMGAEPAGQGNGVAGGKPPARALLAEAEDGEGGMAEGQELDGDGPEEAAAEQEAAAAAPDAGDAATQERPEPMFCMEAAVRLYCWAQYAYRFWVSRRRATGPGAGPCW